MGESDPLVGDITSDGEGNLYLDGLLHGDESRGWRYFFKAIMFGYITFSLFGAAAGPATFGQPQFTWASIPMSVAVLGILIFTLCLSKQYRVDNMPHAWRYGAFALMFCNVCLASSAAIMMHQSFQPRPEGCPPAPMAPMAPMTEMPNTTAASETTMAPLTPSPNPFTTAHNSSNVTNASSATQFDRFAMERYREQHDATRQARHEHHLHGLH